MVRFPLLQLAAADMKDLSAGEFYIEDRSEIQNAALCVLLPFSPERNARQGVALTGPEAFTPRTFDVVGRVYVLRLALDAAQLQLQVDFASSIDPSQAKQGNLVFLSDSTAAIALEPEQGRYRHVLNLRDWKVSRAEHPRFAFARWSVGIVDEHGQTSKLFASHGTD